MIQELVNKALLEEQEKRKDRERSNKWNPSSFGRCLRLQYFNRKDEPQSNPPDLKGLMSMAQGTATHKLIQRYLPKELVEVKVEIEDVLGYLDFEEPNAVVEIKATETWKFKKYHNIPTEFFIENNPQFFIQAGWYAKERKKEFIKIRCNVFGKLDEFVVHKQPLLDWIPKIEEELKTLRGYWAKDELPPACPRAFGKNECPYCSWQTHCKERKDDNHKRTSMERTP